MHGCIGIIISLKVFNDFIYIFWEMMIYILKIIDLLRHQGDFHKSVI